MAIVARSSPMENNLFYKLMLLFCSLTIMNCNGRRTSYVNNDKIDFKLQDVKPIKEPTFLQLCFKFFLALSEVY